MKLKELSQKTKISESELKDYGIEEETTILGAASQIKDLLGTIQNDNESLLHPDMGLTSMIEHSLLDKNQKLFLFKLLKEIAKIQREYRACRIKGQDALIEWMIKFHKYWKTIKEPIAKLNDSLAVGWDSDTAEKIRLEYFG